MLIDTTTSPLASAPVRQPIRAVVNSPMPQPVPDNSGSGSALAFALAAFALAIWAFWPSLDWMISKWIDDPSYSHGFLVPVFSAYLLYLKWQTGEAMTSAPRTVVAALVLTAALPLRLLGGGLLFHQLDLLAFLVTIVAGVLALGGFRLLRVAAPALVFLLFMVPLPYEIEQNVGGPLKSFATVASTFALQTLGYPAVSMGNVIHIDEATLGVVDQCSGLKMLLAFSAFAVGAVLLTKRPLAEQLLILLGFIPIAVFTNVLRITATGIVYASGAEKNTCEFAHDLFGYFMMPLGLALLAGQLWLQSRLIEKPNPNETLAAPGWAPRPATA